MDWTEYTRMLIGLFAIVSPHGMVPLFLSFTDNIKSRRPAIAKVTALAVGIIFTVTILLGQSILSFFSISVDAFRVAGGILLMTIAFGMLEARRGRTRHTPEEDEEAMDLQGMAGVFVAPDFFS